MTNSIVSALQKEIKLTEKKLFKALLIIKSDPPHTEYFDIVKKLQERIEKKTATGAEFQKMLERGAYLEKNLVKLTKEHSNSITKAYNDKVKFEMALGDLKNELYFKTR